MDGPAALRALAGAGLVGRRATPIPGGWANWTFDVDGEWIVRFPRTDEVAAATRRELAVLPVLADAVSFGVPRPTHHGTHAGRPFFAYRRLPGRPVEPGDRHLLPRLGDVLAELHAFPVDLADALLGTPTWREGFEELWPRIERHVLPVLDPDLADRVRREYDVALGWLGDVPQTFVHHDLGPQHVLVDGGDVALIDFEDACVGDPAVDVFPMLGRFGPSALEPLLAGRDLGDRLAERMHFYRWMGSVHAVLYGVTQGDAEELEGGIAELPRRLDA